jgi:FAD/FMN-containing dehydrogenase
VLPDGRIFNGLRALRKDNTGYALKQLFMARKERSASSLRQC